ncbi:MAG: hypothetical protein KDB27_30180 [Planctomycetales bacterium]|nr:hypothetical protein [Planctomycetales bacterium]
MFKRARIIILFCVGTVACASNNVASQVVEFRLDTTDMFGSSIDSIGVGEEFVLSAYTQHVNGYELEQDAGVFAAYLDIAFNENLAMVAGDIVYSPDYSNGKSGDVSSPGLIDNVGSVSSHESLTPPGPDEFLVFSVPLLTLEPGILNFVGKESGESPMYDVLVHGANVPVPSDQINFGSASINVVPEPAIAPGPIALLVYVWFRRRRGMH